MFFIHTYNLVLHGNQTSQKDTSSNSSHSDFFKNNVNSPLGFMITMIGSYWNGKSGVVVVYLREIPLGQ